MESGQSGRGWGFTAVDPFTQGGGGAGAHGARAEKLLD